MDALREMNDFAAFLMECREYKRALEILHYCLTSVPKHMHATIDTNLMTRHKAAVKSSNRSCSHRNHAKTTTDTDASSSTSNGFVYRTPLRLSERELVQSNVDPEVALSSHFIFNVALCHHMIALETMSSTTSHNNNDNNAPLLDKHSINRLRGAIKLYQLGFQSHSEKGLEDISMNYALALINNCASIYEILGSTAKAQRFYNHMLSSLMMMIDGGEAEKIDELDGYLWNASRVILGAENFAAAA